MMEVKVPIVFVVVPFGDTLSLVTGSVLLRPAVVLPRYVNE
jgi:hypothetical protein